MSPAFLSPEITADVDLCTPGGRLNPAAVGWSRRPLHRPNLRRWGRTKRWEYWAVVTPEVIVGMTVSSIDYAGVCGVYVLERASGVEHVHDVVAPLARGVELAARSGEGVSRVNASGLFAAFTETGAGTRLEVLAPGISVDVVAALDPSHESLGVVVPWSERLFQYTVKDVGRAASGVVHVDGRRYDVDAATSFAVLDHGRGRWPYAITWNWGAGSGVVDGRRVDVQVGGRWTDGTGATENALVVDGRLHHLTEPLTWDYDRADWTAPWHVHGPRADLVLEPFHERAARTNLAVVASEVHQCFGVWRGWMADDSGTQVRVDGVVGWAEEARNRW